MPLEYSRDATTYLRGIVGSIGNSYSCWPQKYGNILAVVLRLIFHNPSRSALFVSRRTLQLPGTYTSIWRLVKQHPYSLNFPNNGARYWLSDLSKSCAVLCLVCTSDCKASYVLIRSVFIFIQLLPETFRDFHFNTSFWYLHLVPIKKYC